MNRNSLENSYLHKEIDNFSKSFYKGQLDRQSLCFFESAMKLAQSREKSLEKYEKLLQDVQSEIWDQKTVMIKGNNIRD